MSKINTNQTTDFDPIRAARQGDVKQTGNSKFGTVESKPSVGEDKLQFSGQATEAAKLLEKIKDLPDVRQEKVSALREQISAGEYSPSSDAIADAIIKEES